MPRMRLLLPFLLALAFAWPLAAQELGRYEGEAVVGSHDAGERLAALPRALGNLLVRLSGDPQAATDPQLEDGRARAAELMQQYRYTSLDPQIAGGARLALVASFDRSAVESMLVAAGYRLWPEPRPVPVVWLAIDDGRGPRMLSHAQSQAVAALTRRAAQRGLRLSYPLLDLEDQAVVDVRQVWNFERSTLAGATRRYQSQVALVGRLFRAGGGWTAEWQLLEDGQLLGQLRESDSDAARVLAAGADLAADRLSQHYFQTLSDAGPAGSYAIWIDEVRSAEDYARAVGYLQQLPVVRAVRPARALGERLLVELELTTGVEGLARLVAPGGTLAPLPAQPHERERRFRLEP